MSDIVKGAATAVVDTADSAVASAIEVIGTAAQAAETIVEAPINIAGKTFAAALEEIEKLKGDLFRLIRQVVDTVAEPLP